MILFAASLFFAYPAPVDMPRAEAFFVKDGSSLRLEDRYRPDDLWVSRAVLGRWEDDDGRFFTLSRLDVAPPKFTDSALTRSAYTKEEVIIDPKDDLELRDQAIARLSCVAPATEGLRPRQEIKGFKDVLYFEGTNETAIVCAFRREHGRVWYLATWELAPGDEHDWAREIFEKDFLGNWSGLLASNLRSEAEEESKDRPRKLKTSRAAQYAAQFDGPLAERALLRFDAAHAVTNYPSWHVTEAETFSVLDDLPASSDLIVSVTNELDTIRRRYAEVMPSPVDSSNVLAVARIYSDRLDYLAAAGEDMAWSAAFWSPLRRELVACLPQDGSAEILRTLRHEAFHQYFSYATSMISSSPWINEGYAQYFEDENSLDWRAGSSPVTPTDLERWAKAIPAILGMDYEQFYAGTGEERRIKYRIAWSIAVFIEKGAPLVRFEPFKDLKRDYIAALLKTKDMREATVAAFGSSSRLKDFIAEWLKFWTP